MKKSISLFVITTLFSGLVLAQPQLISGKFGTDGATLKSIPSQNSEFLAGRLFEGLSVGISGGKKIIEANDGEIICKEPRQGIHTRTASCEFAFLGKVAKITTSGAIKTVIFNGEIADKVMAALPKDNSGRVGAVQKQAGNLSCTKVVRPNSTATCTLTDVIAVRM